MTDKTPHSDSIEVQNKRKKGEKKTYTVSPEHYKAYANILYKEQRLQKSWLLSAFIPGLGQIYNRQHWKVPCILGLFGVGGLLIHGQAKDLKAYNRLLLFNSKKKMNLTQKNYYRKKKNETQRALELYIGLTGVFYILCILDAYADREIRTISMKNDIKSPVIKENKSGPLFSSLP